MAYRCEATSVKGFVQQVACVYLRDGYRWYAHGRIPKSKRPCSVDERLIRKYGIDVSQATRWRRKQRGAANLHYIRYERDFVLLASKGRHRFYKTEAKSLRWTGTHSIKFRNYSISYRRDGRTRKGQRDPKWHSHVQICWEHYKELKAMFSGLACRRSPEQLARLFYELPFEPYAPVRRQVGALWAEVNRRRKRAGLPLIPVEVLPMRTKSIKVFEPNRVKRIWSATGGWWYEVRLEAA